MSEDQEEICHFERLINEAMEKNRRVYEEEETSRVSAIEDDDLFVPQSPRRPDVDGGSRTPVSFAMPSYEPQQTSGNQPAFANGHFPTPSLNDAPTDNPSGVSSTAIPSHEIGQNSLSPVAYGDCQYLDDVPNDNQSGVSTSIVSHEYGQTSMPPTAYGDYSYVNNVPNGNQFGVSASVPSREYGQTSMPPTTYGDYSYLNNARNGNQSGVSTSSHSHVYGQTSMPPTTYGDYSYLNNAPTGNQSGVSTSILSREYGQPSMSPTAYGDHSYNSVPNNNLSGAPPTSSREYGQAFIPQQSGSGLYPNSHTNSLPSNTKTRDPRLNQQVQPTPTVDRRGSSSDMGRPEASSVPTERRRRCTCFVGKPCELAAEKGVVDCRSLAPDRSTKPRPTGANAPL